MKLRFDPFYILLNLPNANFDGLNKLPIFLLGQHIVASDSHQYPDPCLQDGSKQQHLMPHVQVVESTTQNNTLVFGFRKGGLIWDQVTFYQLFVLQFGQQRMQIIFNALQGLVKC